MSIALLDAKERAIAQAIRGLGCHIFVRWITGSQVRKPILVNSNFLNHLCFYPKLKFF